MLTVTEADNPEAWNSFLASQKFRPFLQSWEMGEVYREIGQEPVRLEIRKEEEIIGICFGHIIPARRGRHLSIPYGPVVSNEQRAASGEQVLRVLMDTLEHTAKETGCAFIRLSPFVPKTTRYSLLATRSTRPAPLHLLAEHLWYLPLVKPDPWEKSNVSTPVPHTTQHTPEEIFKSMRSTTRNLIRRAEKEGITITASDDPLRDLPLFLALHDETRKRHGFTPYTDAFFQAQVRNFSSLTAHRSQLIAPSCSLYLAHYKDETIAASIHIHFAGETSYHHGASTQKHRNIPASYLLQWQAIQDAIARGDHVYNFWGIAPSQSNGKQRSEEQGKFLKEKQPQELPSIPLSPFKNLPRSSSHPFAGVTLFKTGFGGKLLDLQYCMDLPLRPTYYLTRAFEQLRKWHRGF